MWNVLNIGFQHQTSQVYYFHSGADPGIFVRGGGGPGQSDKKALTAFFF